MLDILRFNPRLPAIEVLPATRVGRVNRTRKKQIQQSLIGYDPGRSDLNDMKGYSKIEIAVEVKIDAVGVDFDPDSDFDLD